MTKVFDDIVRVANEENKQLYRRWDPCERPDGAYIYETRRMAINVNTLRTANKVRGNPSKEISMRTDIGELIN